MDKCHLMIVSCVHHLYLTWFMLQLPMFVPLHKAKYTLFMYIMVLRSACKLWSLKTLAAIASLHPPQRLSLFGFWTQSCWFQPLHLSIKCLSKACKFSILQKSMGFTKVAHETSHNLVQWVWWILCAIFFRVVLDRMTEWQNDRMTEWPTNYHNHHCACAPRVNYTS